MIDDELKILETKSKELIAESERLKSQQDALLSKILELTEAIAQIQANQRLQESN